MNIIKVRPASIQDIEMLSYLAAFTFRHTYEKYNTAADIALYIRTHFTEEVLANAIQQPENTFLLAFNQREQMLGYAKVVRNKVPDIDMVANQYIQLEKIYLLPEVQGKKIGQHLMKACLSLAKTEGFKAIWLGVWKENKAAIQFYEKIGFRVAGNYAFTMGDTVYEEDYWMVKPLTY